MAQASLRWFVNTAWNFLGYQNDTNCHCKNVVHVDHRVMMMKKKNTNCQCKKVVHGDHGVMKKKKSSEVATNESGCGFQMPLHYPRYSKAEYESMEEWKVDMLLREYGLMSFQGSLEQKRAYAMGTFLWPDQY